METIQLGTTDLQVPAMGVGTMMWAGMPGAIKTEEEVLSTFCACLEKGLNFFDTAELYGNGASELVLGRCIKKPARM
jgi:aryl-alcohol dehydrogenase-like predicted oxidoreductase